MTSSRLFILLALSLTACGRADLAPRDPSSACQPGAPIPAQRKAEGFPCWPQGLSPSESSVYVENEALIPAAPAVTWAWLTRADLWSTWFPQATNVHFEQGGPELRPGTVVVWDMIGATIRVTVTRADAPGVLAWEGGASGVHAYHAWLLVPEGTGTRVVTVETERGAVPALFGWSFKSRLTKAHDAWLASLATVAASGRMP